MIMEKTDETIDVTRRQWASLLGLAIGSLAVGGCEAEAGTEQPRGEQATRPLAEHTTNIYWVDTVGSLETFVGGANYIAILQGYNSVGDGGGGLFLWLTTTSLTADKGTVFAVKNDAGVPIGYWIRMFTGPLNVKWWGALGDGSTDDGAAITAAVNAAKAYGPVPLPPGSDAGIPAGPPFAGVKLYFPHGVYLTSAQINFDDTGSTSDSTDFPCVTIEGDGGGAAANYRAASTILYKGTATPFISARSSTGFSIESISILYNNSSFTGTLVDASMNQSIGNNSENMTFRDAVFASDGGTLATRKNLLLLDGAIDGVVENCQFYGAITAIRGLLASGSAGQTNRHTISGCAFGNCSLSAITNPGTQAWVVTNNTFEGTLMPRAIYSDYTTVGSCMNLSFVGNWCGDASTNYRNDPWIDPQYMILSGAVFSGNLFGQCEIINNQRSKDSIALGSCQGVVIQGNTIGTIDFSIGRPGSYSQGVSVNGNRIDGTDTFGSASTPDAPFFRGLSVAGSPGYISQAQIVQIGGNFTSLDNSLDQFCISGHLVTYPVEGVQPTLVATAGASASFNGNDFEGSNDTAGRITLVVSTATASGAQVTLKFARGFDSVNGFPPRVITQAENAATCAVVAQLYVSPSSSQFVLNSTVGLAPGTYVWAYHVMG